MANQGVPGFELLIRCITISLTFIKGPQVDGWVEAMLQGIEPLNPIEANIEYAYTNFLNHFQTQFTDSTKQETAQATLNKHQFKFPFIDQYISDFQNTSQESELHSREQRVNELLPKRTESGPQCNGMSS
jgi:hypothetical protein